MVPSEYPLPAARARMADLERALANLCAALPARYGLYVEDLQSGLKVAMGADAACPAGEMYPLVLCLYAFSQAADGKLDLTGEVEYRPEDRTTGTGPMQSAVVSDRLPMDELCEFALARSDDIARRMLERVLGEGNVNAWLREIGGRNGRRSDADMSSPADYALYLKCLLALADRRPLLGGTMLEWLTQNAQGGTVSALPDGVTVAHRVACGARGALDVGVVFMPKAPYVLCVTADSADAAAFRTAAARIGRLVYDALAPMAGTFACVYAGGMRLDTPCPACVMQGEPVGPVAEVAEALGAQVRTDQVTHEVTVSRNGRTVRLRPDSTQMETESGFRTLSTAPLRYEGTLCAPLVPVLTAIGLHADWDTVRNRLTLLPGAGN